MVSDARHGESRAARVAIGPLGRHAVDRPAWGPHTPGAVSIDPDLRRPRKPGILRPAPAVSTPAVAPRPGAAAGGRASAARIVGQRIRLQEVGVALSRTLDPKGVAALIVDAACEGLGAPMGLVAVATTDQAAVEILHASGFA